ncbi:GIY-YIG nuclease family protein [Chitinophaga japonensis]|uniref:Meiotically Up-regulated Gene 113 (MUG113) protein n=1 Tax=Chitinophaga japonensis TaxID=104662 RepID=A0A562T4E9_CHIJA|nr:GIY-YIG nuclease family protein [Chitinophaga japonensis]TWI87936.1 Meiotically Up-regulated Gene 113 (MUG113) protein [Chitinophaga japonensis]
MEQVQNGHSVYILKTGKNLYKIGKTQDLQKRLASYHTHLPIIFRVVRQYTTPRMDELEENLHTIFQHRRVKGEWFELHPDDLIICDNIARSYARVQTRRHARGQRQELHFSSNPMLQMLAANEKYLHDYSRIADDLQLGLSIDEVFILHDGEVSKTIIATVKKLLQYRTPNAAFLGQWWYIVNDLGAGMSENKVLEKYKGQTSRTTVQMIKRILKHQMY